MNRSFQFATLALGMALSTGAMAQSHTYFEVGAGLAEVAVDCAGTSSCDRRGTGFKMLAGHDFGAGLSAEVGYSDFGKAKMRSGASKIDVNAAAVTLGMGWKAALSPNASLHMRLGLANVETKVEAYNGFISSSDSESKSAPYFGLGLGFATSQRARLQIGVDATRSEYRSIKSDVRAVTMGARFTL